MRGNVKKFVFSLSSFLFLSTTRPVLPEELVCQTTLQLTHEIELTRRAREFADQSPGGLLDFSRRPKDVPITNLAFALGRLQLGNPAAIEAIKNQEQELIRRYERLRRTKDLSAEELMLMGLESQFYRELREVISGEALPIPGQSDSQIEDFIHSGVSLTWALREARRRVDLFRARAIGSDPNQIDYSVQFYERLAAKLSQRLREIEAKN